VLVPSIGWNQTSHYALVRALSSGTAKIDPYIETTGDRVTFEGHYYSNKAPGLALTALPLYAAIDAVGDPHELGRAVSDREVDGAIWALGLFAVVLPALGSLLLVRNLGERAEPGFGTAAAVTLGVATLLLPFSTLFFSHALAAFLGLAAFALLWREREGAPRLPLVAAAGALAGLAVAVEYPLALVGVVVGAYGAARRPFAQRGLAFAAGAVVGALPLLSYNLWAFGSATNVALADDPRLERGLFGVQLPRPRVALELLASPKGVLVLTPVIALSLVGLVLLYRRGRRAESMTIGAVAAGAFAYNSGFYLPGTIDHTFGGETPGPRHLISALPFLAVPLAVAYRRLPLTAVALAAVSAVWMLAATVTDPMVSVAEVQDGIWPDRIASGDFTDTLATTVGVGLGWLEIVPFLALVGAALFLAVRATGQAQLSRADALTAVGALASWGLIAYAGPYLLGLRAGEPSRHGDVALAALIVTIPLTLLCLHRVWHVDARA
jgi:hypothetical protein